MRILLLSQRLPYAPNRGDRIRALHELRFLATFAEVHVASLAHDDDEAAHADDLRGIAASVATGRVPAWPNRLRGVRALPGPTPLTHALLHSPALEREVDRMAATVRPDLVFCVSTGVAPLALRAGLRHVPCVLDMVDVDSAKWAALAPAARAPLSWVYRREASTLGAFERAFCAHARATLVVNDREAALLDGIVPRDRLHVVENGIDLAHFRRPGEGPRARHVVFTGVMNYGPNVEGAIWLAREVWPAVRAACPDAVLQLVGAAPSASVRALASPALGIEVTGTVPDTRPYLWNASVAAAPLMVARGVQNKVLEALAAGLPAVVTPAAFDGLPGAVRPYATEAEGVEAFGRALIERLEARATAHTTLPPVATVLEGLGWAQRLAPLKQIAIDAAAR